MISRLSAAAAVFAVFATAGLAFAAHAQQRPLAARTSIESTPAVIVLPTVVVTGHRIARS